MIEHGEVLSTLQQQERSPFFAFLDLDIFAAGVFLPALLKKLNRRSGVFTCSSISADEENEIMPSGFQIMSDQYHRLHDGRCVGNSYFAIYSQRDLNAIIRRWTVTFRRYRWREIPLAVRQVLRADEVEKASYDTGKLINVLLTLEGKRLAFVPEASLFHLGGISSRLTIYRNEGIVRSQLRKWLPTSLLRSHYYLVFRKWISRSETETISRRAAKRYSSAAFFIHVLKSSANRKTDPIPLNFNGFELRKSIREAAGKLKEGISHI